MGSCRIVRIILGST
ncbi:hypothetical protein GQ600_6964 [Phytophthora cactorum]|nr:hypothetical protein GQ600_6964 [Phytophthora cactorum]